jgi:ribosome-binding ATPase
VSAEPGSTFKVPEELRRSRLKREHGFVNSKIFHPRAVLQQPCFICVKAIFPKVKKEFPMGFNCGIVGLPNVGKSTIFNALTSAGAQASNYPFTTIDPNVGIVDMPDERLDKLAEIYQPKKVTPTSMEFVDIAGLVKGAAQGEGLGNKFLANIREVDAVAHVVRCFEDPNVIHVAGKVDPKADIEVIEAELMLADLDAIEKRLFKAEKMIKTGDKKAADEVVFMKRLKDMLSRGEPIRRATHSEDELTWLKSYALLSAKPVLYVANVAEDMVDKPNPLVEAVKNIAAAEGAKAVVISGQVEGEIAQLPKEERREYLAGMGLKESGLDRMIRAGYELLGLLTYFTAGEKEVRAWTITKGTKAPQAAGKIHTDFEKGFIRAEVFHYDDLIRLKTEQAVKAAGLLRSEGKDYVVKDGDIMLFRFNV